MKSLQLSEPHLLIVVGGPGSGKSTFAAKFAEMFHAPFIDGGQILSASLDHRAAVYLATMILSEIQRTNQTLVYEPISGTKVERTEIAKAAVKAGYKPLVIWLQTDKYVAEARATRKSRSNPHPMTVKEFEQHNKRFTPPSSGEKYVVVSGMHTFATQARVVLRKVSEHIVRPAVKAAPARTDTTQQQRSITVR